MGTVWGGLALHYLPVETGLGPIEPFDQKRMRASSPSDLLRSSENTQLGSNEIWEGSLSFPMHHSVQLTLE